MVASLVLVSFALAATGSLPAQRLFDAAPGERLRIPGPDRAVLAGSRNRADLDCHVEPLDPQLAFDLNYRAGYLIHLRAEAVPTHGDRLHVLFRVQPLAAPGVPPVYFRQAFNVPANRADGSSAVFPGRYLLGPGRYKVDWLMRNLQGRVCSAHWQVRAPQPGHTGRLAAAATPNLVAPDRQDPFADEPPVARAGGPESLLHISLLLNLAPLDRTRFKLSSYELNSLVGMLRALHREPIIGRFSLAAFSGADRQVVYAASERSRLDFAALGAALEARDTGVVAVEDLADPEGEPRFLADLLNRALGPEASRPDAVVVLGPKVDRGAAVPAEMLTISDPPPLFRIVFDRNPHSYPWPGALETALKPHGLVVYGVTRPQDYGRVLESLLGALAGDSAEPGLPPLADEFPAPPGGRTVPETSWLPPRERPSSRAEGR